MRSEQEVNSALERYADTIRRVCLLHLKNEADCEDIFQTIFLKYMLHDPPFESEAHERAWLLRVTINACKDLRKSFFRSRTVSLDTLLPLPAMPDEQKEVLQAVCALPVNYKNAVYLHYYEGYTAPEIGKLLGKNVNTIYTWLTRAREILRKELGGAEVGR